MTIEQAAELRQAQWLSQHGSHEWESHDLVQEAMEEAVDGWVYLRAKLTGFNGPMTSRQMSDLVVASNYFRRAYEKLEGLP